MARSVSAEDFGRFSFVLALIGVGLLVSDAGLQVATTRLIAAERQRAGVFLCASLLLGGLASALIYVAILVAGAGGLLPEGVSASAAIFGTALLLTAVIDPYWSLLRGFERQDLVYAAYAVSSIALLGGILGATAAGVSIEWLFVVYAASYVVRLAVTVVFVRAGVERVRIGFDRGAARLILGTAPAAAATFTLVGFYARIDVVLLGYLVSAADVGAYAAAYRLVDASMFLSAGAVTAAAFPVFARLAKNESGGARDLYDRLARLTAAALAPVALVLMAVATPLTKLIYGDGIEGVDRLLTLLAPSIPLIAVNYLTVFFLLAIDRPRAAVLTTAAAAALNVVANLAVVPVAGVEAAAGATFLAEAALLLLLGVSLARAGLRSTATVSATVATALIALPFGLSEIFVAVRTPILLVGAVVAALALRLGGLVDAADLTALRRALHPRA